MIHLAAGVFVCRVRFVDRGEGLTMRAILSLPVEDDRPDTDTDVAVDVGGTLDGMFGAGGESVWHGRATVAGRRWRGDTVVQLQQPQAQTAGEPDKEVHDPAGNLDGTAVTVVGKL